VSLARARALANFSLDILVDGLTPDIFPPRMPRFDRPPIGDRREAVGRRPTRRFFETRKEKRGEKKEKRGKSAKENARPVLPRIRLWTRGFIKIARASRLSAPGRFQVAVNRPSKRFLLSFLRAPRSDYSARSRLRQIRRPKRRA